MHACMDTVVTSTCIILYCAVKYSLKSVEIPRKLTAPKDRLTIWVGKGRNKGEIGAYQPEEDGYEVASIIKGLLSYRK